MRALIISGHTRSLAETADNILKLSEVLDALVFIHTWTAANTSTPTWHAQELYSCKVDLSVFSESARVKSVEIEDQESISSLYDMQPPPGYAYMVYGMLRAFAAAKNYASDHNLSLDLVIRSRFDNEVLTTPSYVAAMINDLPVNTAGVVAHNWLFGVDTYYDGFFIVPASSMQRLLNCVNEKGLLRMRVPVEIDFWRQMALHRVQVLPIKVAVRRQSADVIFGESTLIAIGKRVVLTASRIGSLYPQVVADETPKSFMLCGFLFLLFPFAFVFLKMVRSWRRLY